MAAKRQHREEIGARSKNAQIIFANLPQSLRLRLYATAPSRREPWLAQPQSLLSLCVELHAGMVFAKRQDRAEGAMKFAAKMQTKEDSPRGEPNHKK